MKKIIMAVVIASVFAMYGCSSSTVGISGRLLGLNGKSVYLEQISGGGGKIVDSVKLGEDGSYRFTVEVTGSTPSLYNMIYNGERVPLLLTGGERVTVNSVGSLLRNYNVTGSEESELLREFNREYIEGLERMNSILEQFSGNTLSDIENRELVRDYTAAYREAKRNQLRFIIEHKDRIAAVYALYQRFPGETNLFSTDGDIIYYRTVADAVEARYPESPFLPTLRTEIANMDARRTLISQITETNYPDIELPDMFGNNIRMSSFDGEVILLSFWSTGMADANVQNAELKELYSLYSERGFEIYQVCVETSKAAWINTVQEQRLPWTSVCDLRNGGAGVLGLYNVRRLPANFLFDRSGNIVGRDLHGEELERALAKLFE
ncbi:MAG: AhpC/TSA family protein [Alistipes sp.]|nr:AhpC/TSA family protein [Alistipes sp.]